MSKSNFIKQKIFKPYQKGTRDPRFTLGIVVIVLIAILGIRLLFNSHAASPYAQAEAESTSNTITNPATVQTDTNASGSKYVQFGAPSGGGGTSGGCTSGGVAAPCIGSATTGASGWGSTVFDDEFSGTSLDTTKWCSSWFSGGSMNNVSTSASNVAVSGGNLLLTLSSSSVGALVDTNHNDCGITGFNLGTGYYAEARIYFPGSGTTIDNWPAWWTDGQSWPANGEIDIAEGLGSLTSNYHSNSGANNSTPSNSDTSGTWAGGFHTYGVDREAGTNYIYWDGKLIRQYTTDDAGAPEYLILNVGNGEGPAVYGTASQVKVDYVRAWKK